MELAKVTSKGQITIPVEIRKQLNLKPGDKVIFMEENGKITLANSSGRVNYQASNDLVTDSSCLQEKLKEMANDSDIQKEINAINQEFESTERDGLEQLFFYVFKSAL